MVKQKDQVQPIVVHVDQVSDELALRDHILKGIRHEDSLVHQRITWLMVLNGFLFAFLGQLMRVRESRRGLQEQAILNIESSVQNISQNTDVILSDISSLKQNVSAGNIQNQLASAATQITSQSKSIQQIQNDINTVKNAFGDLSGALSMTIWIGIISSAILFLVIGFYWFTSSRRWKQYDNFFHTPPSLKNPIPIVENQNWGWLIMLILLSIPGFLIFTWYQLMTNVL